MQVPCTQQPLALHVRPAQHGCPASPHAVLNVDLWGQIADALGSHHGRQLLQCPCWRKRFRAIGLESRPPMWENAALVT
jgi:hypothetical protein